MRRSIPIRLLSCLLTAVMLFTTFAITAHAEGNSGKYLKDVFIAYGENKTNAENWLRDNGWEPFEDLNDGKTSNVFTNAVAVMGIRRTDDPSEAITDMATMNMKGGYSFDDYEGLVKQKKADITEFINTFVPALKEYRDNYNGKGSEGGQKRAQMAHDLLNKFYDGDPEGDYAVNDTGKPLGDLLLNKTKTEIGDDAYNALSQEEKMNTADFQQIILESTGPAVSIIEQTLALATDTAEDSWLDRLEGLTGSELVDNIEEYAPEAEGQDLAPSAAMNLLASHFEDYSKKLAGQWINIHENILWFEQYCDDHELWEDKDNAELDIEITDEYFTALSEEDENRYIDESNRFTSVKIYYSVLHDIAYPGDWGDTLYEFFRPEDEDEDYSEEYEWFAPLAAALSDGQRAALEFISLSTLLKLGADSDSVMEADFPSTKEIFKNNNGEEMESISIYSGINRAIFRKGVALTSDALMQKSLGKDPYDQLWDLGGIVDIVSYTSFAVGAVNLAAGIGMAFRGARAAAEPAKALAEANSEIAGLTKKLNLNNKALEQVKNLSDAGTKLGQKRIDLIEKVVADVNEELKTAQDSAKHAQDAVNSASSLSTAGKWMMGIGGALMIMAAILKAVQMSKYYNRTFSNIPIMIVDEADIVSYTTEANGNQVKNINFDQFAYYEVVKCNRQEVGIHEDAQGGVDQYKEWGCGDAADLNADVGKQWLAMYVNRSSAKGDPILADSLKLLKGENGSTMPSDCDGCLHMFTFENPVKIDDMNYSYRGDSNGMYLYWKGDENAFPAPAAASAFNAGFLALAGVGGLALGILGTTLVMLPKRKKKEEEA